jgi:hypothetical protein
MGGNMPIQPKRRFRFLLAIQAVVALSLFWLLLGCFYFPTFGVRMNKSQPDFRDKIGDEKSKRPIRPGAVRKEDVIRILGQPQFASDDGSAIAYALDTERSAWVWPMCFTAVPAQTRTYGLRLSFGDDGVLNKWKLVQSDQSQVIFGYAPMPILSGDLLKLLNAEGPPLRLRFYWSTTLPSTEP